MDVLSKPKDKNEVKVDKKALAAQKAKIDKFEDHKAKGLGKPPQTKEEKDKKSLEGMNDEPLEE